jgi:PPOX class probable F420-dependent enzyme
MNVDDALNAEGLTFLTDRHLATLSTIAPDGSLHVVAVGFTVADGVVRIITGDGTQKVRNVERDGRATVAQVEGARWVSIAGTATIERDPEAVARAVELYAARYKQPRVNPQRVVIRIEPHKLLASAGLRSKGVNA